MSDGESFESMAMSAASNSFFSKECKDKPNSKLTISSKEESDNLEKEEAFQLRCVKHCSLEFIDGIELTFKRLNCCYLKQRGLAMSLSIVLQGSFGLKLFFSFAQFSSCCTTFSI